jgi:hypothetical protein
MEPSKNETDLMLLIYAVSPKQCGQVLQAGMNLSRRAHNIDNSFGEIYIHELAVVKTCNGSDKVKILFFAKVF